MPWRCLGQLNPWDEGWGLDVRPKATEAVALLVVYVALGCVLSEANC